jgi:hypothetical protein
MKAEAIGLSGGEWETALDHFFVDQVKLAVASPLRGEFWHDGKLYYRHDNGNVYRKIND